MTHDQFFIWAIDTAGKEPPTKRANILAVLRQLCGDPALAAVMSEAELAIRESERKFGQLQFAAAQLEGGAK